MCGVKVVRFSVGFGKPFSPESAATPNGASLRFRWAVTSKWSTRAKSKYQKPIYPTLLTNNTPPNASPSSPLARWTNLALAVLLYGLSFSFGVTELCPYVGTVELDFIAARASFQSGDKLQSVNGTPVADWGSAQTEIVLNLEASKVAVGVQTASGAQTVRTIDAVGTPEAGTIAKSQGYIGLMPFKITTVLGGVEKGSPA